MNLRPCKALLVASTLVLTLTSIAHSSCSDMPAQQAGVNTQAPSLHPSGVVNGSNGVFTLPSTPTDASCVRVAVSGRELRLNIDFQVAGAQLTIAPAAVPHLGDIVSVSIPPNAPLGTREMDTASVASGERSAVLREVLIRAMLKDLAPPKEPRPALPSGVEAGEVPTSGRFSTSVAMLQRRLLEPSQLRTHDGRSRRQRSGGYEGTNEISSSTLYKDLLSKNSDASSASHQDANQDRSESQQHYRSLAMLGMRLDQAEQHDVDQPRGRR